MKMMREMTCFGLVAAILMLLGGGMLMSFDTAYAEGTGTQDDPYSGSVTLQVEDGMEYWAYVGTYMDLISSGRGLSCSGTEGTGLEQSGHVVSGTLIATGTFEIYFSPGGGDDGGGYPYSFTLHIVSDAPDLEFLSSPIDDGVIVYA